MYLISLLMKDNRYYRLDGLLSFKGLVIINVDVLT